MKKRIVTFLLALVLFLPGVFLFVGCGKEGDEVSAVGLSITAKAPYVIIDNTISVEWGEFVEFSESDFNVWLKFDNNTKTAVPAKTDETDGFVLTSTLPTLQETDRLDGKNNNKTKIGNYTLTFNYGNYASYVIDVKVEKVKIDVGDILWNYSEAFVYDGSEKSVSVKTSSLPSGVEVSSYNSEKATNAGSYVAVANLVSTDQVHYEINKTSVSLDWEIEKATYDVGSISFNKSYVYDGTEKTTTQADFDVNLNDDIEVTSFESQTGTTAGVYTAKFGINYTGLDKDNFNPIDEFFYVSWAILRSPVARPVQDSTEFTYNGNQQTYNLAQSSGYEILGNKQKEAGTYNVFVVLNDNYEWQDGEDVEEMLTFTFVINQLLIAKPVADETEYVYDGTAKTYQIEASDYYIVNGKTQTNAGNYEVNVILKNNASTRWADETSSELTYLFEIKKADLSGIVVSRQDYVNGNNHSALQISECEGNKTYYYNTDENAVDGWKTFTQSTNLEVGQYYFYAVVAETSNYNSFTTPKASFKVLQAVALTGTTNYASLAEAVANIQTNGTIYLLCDTQISSQICFEKSATLELYGKTITCNSEQPLTSGLIAVKQGASLTITDYVGGGKIDASNASSAIEVTLPGETDTTKAAWLVIEGGTFIGNDSAIKVRAGHVQINNGTFTALAEEFSSTDDGNGKVIVGSAIAVSQYIENQETVVLIFNGTFNGKYTIYEDDNNSAEQSIISVTVLGGQFNATSYKNSQTYSKHCEQSVTPLACVKVSSTSYNFYFDVSQLFENCSTDPSTYTTVYLYKNTEQLTVPANKYVYLYANSKELDTLVNNGNLKTSGTFTGDVVNSGTMIIPSGTFNKDFTNYGSLSIQKGVFNESYEFVNAENAVCDIAITGKTTFGKVTNAGTMLISKESGTYTPSVKNLLTNTGDLTLSSGTFTTASKTALDSATLVDGYGCYLKYASGAESYFVDAVSNIKTTITRNEKVYYSTYSGDTILGSATLAGEIVAGDKVTLMKDWTNVPTIVIKKGVTLDLNGHSLVFKNTGFISIEGATLTVVDSGAERTGTISSATTQNVIQIVGEDSKFVLNGGTISSTIASVGVALFEAGQFEMNGGTIVSPSIGVSGNGTSENWGTTITIIDGTITAGETAIYHPQVGTMTISGGSISGKTAVEVRAGTVTITSGSFISTAETYSKTPNGNGTTMVGVALAISQHTTNQEITVIVDGGSFEGIYALTMVDTVNPSTFNDHMNVVVNGGTFRGKAGYTSTTVRVENGTLLVKDGTFSVGADENNEGNSTIYVMSYGKIIVEGGEFSSDEKYNNKYWVLNIKNADKATANLIVKGGTFHGFNPAGPNTDDLTSYLSVGYKSVENDGVWTVSEDVE